MINTSNKTYRELSLPYFKEVFVILDKVCRDFGIEYYLIGAQARNFHLLENGIAPSRGTQDIDFAVMLPEMKAYDEMKNRLIESGFRKVNEPYRLIHDITNTVIDLLPFGEIEEDGTVTFTERKTELSVVGMKEVNEYTVNAELGGLTLKVSPLEGIVILKLISFSEKPEREKDLDDISEILSNYFNINEDRFHTDHLDIVDGIPNENYIHLAGARLMGRDMKKIISLSEKLSKQIEATIQNELEEKTGSMTKYFLSKNIFKDYELIKNIFSQLLKGIKE
jgi:predicted nucleotidyltransferase